MSGSLVSLLAALAAVAAAAAGAAGSAPLRADLSEGPQTAGDRAQAAFLPTLYRTKANEWGCCRLCGEAEAAKAKEAAAKAKGQEAPEPPRPVPLQFADPSRHVNCCPFCPWPSYGSGAGSGLGAFEHYYQKHEPGEREKYEAELDKFARPAIPPVKPRDPDLWRYYDPSEDNGDFVETAASAGMPNFGDPKSLMKSFLPGGPAGGGAGPDLGKLVNTVTRQAAAGNLGKLATNVVKQQAPAAASSKSATAGGDAAAAGGESSGPDPNKAGPFDMADPYVMYRGMQMKRSETYVYGKPERRAVQEKGALPAKRDLPPCCNVCQRSHDTLMPLGDASCCVHCASTLTGQAPWRTRREKAAMQEKMDARKTTGGSVEGTTKK